jgi:hypothetical protein
MHTIIQTFFDAAMVFVRLPILAHLVGAVFLTLLTISYLKTRRFRPGFHLGIGLTAILWVLFGFMEARIGPEANIRVDLLFAWPPLACVTLVSAIAVVRDLISKPAITAAPSDPVDPGP